MKFYIPLLSLLSLFSCQYESKFNLEKDLYQFSDKMENNDTLEVHIDHSACTLSLREVYTFIKQNISQKA